MENINNAPHVIGVVAGLCALSTLVVALRISVRLFLVKQSLGWDDAAMVFAVVCAMNIRIPPRIVTLFVIFR